MTTERPRRSLRLSDDEVWEFVRDAHTGVMTTLRRDGMPISLPVWFAAVDRIIYIRTRGRKLQRIANDPRTEEAQGAHSTQARRMWHQARV